MNPGTFGRLLTSQRLRFLFPIALAVLTYLAYAPALTGSLFYDDVPNLDALTSVNDIDSALTFIFSGDAGPLGRPLALASFLPQAAGWPDNSAQALRVNIILHIANGGLLFLLGYQLLDLRGRTDSARTYAITLSAAALWLVMPLLASTSLITIQRMTSLSAFFGLLGLNAFVRAFYWQVSRPRLALITQALGLGFGTLLAMLCKESGALIPIFALVIDSVLLNDLPAASIHRRLRRVVLWLGLCVLIGYLIYVTPHPFRVDGFRGFSPAERLLTETVLLWKYLFLAFFPRLTEYGPFHDDVRIIQGLALPLLATGGFALTTLFAYRVRRNNPWLLFALLWFFTGHLLESSVTLLELYFEHRNYLAVYGFCLALAYAAWNAPRRLKHIAPLLLALYISLLWVVLLLVTMIWGNPYAAAANWVQNHPASSRAATSLSALHYHALGDVNLAKQVLDQAAVQCPKCLELKMGGLIYACGRETPEAVLQRFEDLLKAAPTGNTSSAALDALYPLRRLLQREACPPLTTALLRQFPTALLSNPAFGRGGYRVHAYGLAALFAYDEGDRAAAYDLLEQAATLGPALGVLQFRVQLLNEDQRYDEALALIEEQRPGHSAQPWVQADRERQLDALIKLVEDARQNRQAEPTQEANLGQNERRRAPGPPGLKTTPRAESSSKAP